MHSPEQQFQGWPWGAPIGRQMQVPMAPTGAGTGQGDETHVLSMEQIADTGRLTLAADERG